MTFPGLPNTSRENLRAAIFPSIPYCANYKKKKAKIERTDLLVSGFHNGDF